MDEQKGSRFRIPWKRIAIRRRDTAALRGDWRTTIRSRLLVGAIMFGLWTAGIEARLFYLQVIRHAEMMSRADRQQLRTIKAPAKRGEILDRTGRVLAYSVDADTIVADPTEVSDPESVSAAICGALDDCDSRERQTMARNLRRKGQFAWLARTVSPDEARRVKALQLPGVGFLKESRRYYPNKDLLSHVLGYVGVDNVGLAGLEFTFDSLIRGREGKVLVQTDARQHALFSRMERQATSGATLELTIDHVLQYMLERELRAGVEHNRAAGGSALIMEPQTGEILAMASWPTFNPNSFRSFGDEAKRNRTIQDLYEPGSTFKVVTASAALEEQLINPSDPIDCGSGHIAFGSRVIRDMHAYGVLPFRDVIVKSSNVGAVRVGLRLGAERLGRYVNRFGFGQTLSPDFRGENPGIVWNPARLDSSALASISMGYQVGVTSLQMAAAVSSVANGGTLFEPHIVRAVIKDGRRTAIAHKPLRRTISEGTAAALTDIMEGVVDRGTATAAQIDGYTIAGKTGTAHKLIDGRYSPSEYNASFVGFLPSRKPALTIIVVIDSPHGNGYTGGVVAAPIFKRIAEASLRHLGIAPTVNPVPPVLVARNEVPREVAPQPVSATTLLGGIAEHSETDVMPDLRGLSARDALRTLTRIGMTAKMSGAGFVLEQSPEPGTLLDTSGACVIKLGRRPVGGAEGRPPQPIAGGAPQ
jgi:cell division protein FtsI (penicillin-binding protein 3)